MSTDLAVNEAAPLVPELVALQKQYDDQFSGIAGTFQNFHPRLQLFTSNSDEVKRAKIGVANYGIIEGKEKKLTDLGKEVVIVPLCWRPKAMFVKADPVLAYHNPLTKEFQDIKEKAKEPNSGNMFGPEFFVWLPDQKVFATFFMGSKTARNEAQNVRILLPTPEGRLRAGVLSAKFIETKEYSWHGPSCTMSSQSFEYPPVKELQEYVAEFMKPRDSAVKEEAPADATQMER